MEKIVLFGAGQMGIIISRLMGPDYSICCFADNSEAKRGSNIRGIPVCSPDESLTFSPDLYCICVLDSERSSQIESQIRSIGFGGTIIRPDCLRAFDSRVAVMRLLAEQINDKNIPGDVAELGVYKGDFASLINSSFPDRTIHLFDTFEGFDERDLPAEREMNLSKAKSGDFSGTSEVAVLACLPHGENAVVHKGYFPDTFTCTGTSFAFVSIDADLYLPTAAALPLFYDRLSPGGVLLVHDVNGSQFSGPGKAVDEFCEERNLLSFPVSDLHGSVVLRKPLV